MNADWQDVDRQVHALSAFDTQLVLSRIAIEYPDLVAEQIDRMQRAVDRAKRNQDVRLGYK